MEPNLVRTFSCRSVETPCYEPVQVDTTSGTVRKLVNFEHTKKGTSKKAKRNVSYLKAVKKEELPSAEKDDKMKPKDLEEVELIQTSLTNLQSDGEASACKNTTSTGKKIDFVLVYSKSESDEEEEKDKEKKRNYYEQQLKKEKLILEHKDGTSGGVRPVSNMYVVKLSKRFCSLYFSGLVA